MATRVDPAADNDLEICIAIRVEVFVVGQNVPRELEVDGLDGEAAHFLARVEGDPAGTARLRVVDAVGKAERVAVLDRYRGAGVGRALMEALEAEARRRGRDCMRLNAQVAVIPFYESLGYAAEGEVFMEADIPHRAMTKRIGSAPR